MTRQSLIDILGLLEDDAIAHGPSRPWAQIAEELHKLVVFVSSSVEDDRA